MRIEYTKENPLRCFFAFEGYNSQGLALNRLKQNYPDFDWVCVGRSEIDKYTIQAADALFPEAKDKNYGDISKISWSDVPDFDLFTMSVCCQDISAAGRQMGLAEGSGTRSSLLWECRRAILAKKPKYILFENVKALVSHKFLPYFLKWQNELASYGYSNFAKVLNSKCYGIPQNRERIFMVSILDENASYHFPEPFPLDKRLKDVLEEDVDEKYYLSKKIRKEYESGELKESRHNMQQLEPSTDGVCNTITSVQKDCLIIEPKIVQKARGFNKGAVMELSPSITSSSWENNNFVSEPVAKVLTKTAQNEPQCYYEGNNEENNKNLDNHEQRGIFKGDYQDFTDKILRILRKHLGEEEIQRKIRRLVSILKKEVLRQRMHEESVCDSGIKRSEVQSCTPLCEEDKISDRGQAEGVRDMRFKEEYRCSPQGWELSEQFATELNDIMSFLPHEDAREINEGLHYMRQTYGVSWVLQQALSSLEEIWGSINGEREESFRIRKLSEREVFRLMDVDDADIDKIQAAGISRSQQCKLAGNSIVTSVLYHLFRKLFIDTSCESKQLSIF